MSGQQTLTSANSVLAIAIASVYPVPQIMQGFSTDDAFSSAEIKPTEAMMGVDGKLSAGYTPQPFVQTIVLQADSKSNQVFDDWFNAMDAAKDVYYANGSVLLQGTGQKYALVKGTLTSYSPMPDAKKVLQPRRYEITWESKQPSPI